jgi:hypothetical protein
MDTGQLNSTLTPGGNPLTRTVTIDDAMSFHVLITNDTEVSMMSLLVFLTLQIPISSLTLAPPIWGPNGEVMETHRNIVLTVALGADDDFQSFLANFFIVDPMLPYEVIHTRGESQAIVAPSPPFWLPALMPA